MGIYTLNCFERDLIVAAEKARWMGPARWVSSILYCEVLTDLFCRYDVNGGDSTSLSVLGDV